MGSGLDILKEEVGEVRREGSFFGPNFPDCLGRNSFLVCYLNTGGQTDQAKQLVQPGSFDHFGFGLKHSERSLIVQRCITWDRPGHLHHIEGEIDLVEYFKIYTKLLLGILFGNFLTVYHVIFEQDNNLTRISILAIRWLRDNNATVLS